MKPLELTVYPPMPIGKWEIDERRMWWQDRADELDDRDAKRFTDAELAAEYWALYSEYVREASNVLHCQERYMEAAGKSFQKADRKCRVLHRFATLPHYDEVSL